jgi:hypothetical protein
MERFEVRTDRAALRRYIRRRMWVLTALNIVQMAMLGALLGLVGGTIGGIAAPLISGAVVGAFACGFGYIGALTGPLPRLRKRLLLDRVLVLDPDGLWLPMSAEWGNEVRLPWAAVGDVTSRRIVRHPVVAIRVRPGVSGVVGLDDPEVLRVATGPGLVLGTRFTDSDTETVLAAINRFRLAAAPHHPDLGRLNP